MTACGVADLDARGRSRAQRFGAPSNKVCDMLKISKSLQQIECMAWRCRDGNSRWVGILCAKDVVDFVRIIPPPPPVLVLPVPAWALVLVI